MSFSSFSLAPRDRGGQRFDDDRILRRRRQRGQRLDQALGAGPLAVVDRLRPSAARRASPSATTSGRRAAQSGALREIAHQPAGALGPVSSVKIASSPMAVVPKFLGGAASLPGVTPVITTVTHDAVIGFGRGTQ